MPIRTTIFLICSPWHRDTSSSDCRAEIRWTPPEIPLMKNCCISSVNEEMLPALKFKPSSAFQRAPPPNVSRHGCNATSSKNTVTARPLGTVLNSSEKTAEPLRRKARLFSLVRNPSQGFLIIATTSALPHSSRPCARRPSRPRWRCRPSGWNHEYHPSLHPRHKVRGSRDPEYPALPPCR